MRPLESPSSSQVSLDVRMSSGRSVHASIGINGINEDQMSLNGESLGSVLHDEYVTFHSCYRPSSTASLALKRIDIKPLYFSIALQYCE